MFGQRGTFREGRCPKIPDRKKATKQQKNRCVIHLWFKRNLARSSQLAGTRAGKMSKLRSREAFAAVEVIMVRRDSGENLMIITGGLLKPHAGVVGFAVPTTARLVNGIEVNFVAARLNDHWLLKTVGGDSAVKGFCKYSQVLTLLKDKLIAACEAQMEKTSTAVADDDDPMAKLKKVDDTPLPKQRKILESPMRTRLASKQEVHSIRMAKNCKCADDVEVLAYRTNNGHVWIRVTDVLWFVSYIHSEMNGGKVPEPWDPDEASATAVAEASATAEAENTDIAKPYRVAWCPEGSWLATITSGPLRGKEYRSWTRDMTKDKWIKGAACLGYTQEWAEEHCKRGDRSMTKKVLLAFITDTVEKRIKEAEEEVAAAELPQSR